MDPQPPEPQPRRPPDHVRQKNLTAEQRRNIVTRLLWELKDGHRNGKFARGVLTALAEEFHVSYWTIRRVWKRAIQNFEDPTIRQLRSSPRKPKNSGRKKKWNRDEVREAIKEIPLHKRRSIRALAAALGIPASTLFLMKKGDAEDQPVIRPCTSALKPALTAHHKLIRCEYAMSKLDPVDLQYNDFYQSVHVDEKWFFISEKQLHLYIVPGEELPPRSCQNKDHILKVMFLCALARPRFAPNGDCLFDGKIGMFPIVESVVAQRTSRHRPRGANIVRPVNVTKERYRQLIVEKVVPAIKEKWPCRNRNIVIQQDGASSHIDEDDAAFVEVAQTGTWNITLETQPPKSPDLNVLDLSFFRALQSYQWRSGFVNTIEELIVQVQRAYETFPPRSIDFAFLTLQCCIDDILAIHGDNDYFIRHMGKEGLLRMGMLPTRIVASAPALRTYNLMHGPVDRHVDDNGDDGNFNGHAAWEEENVQMIQQQAV